MTDIVITTTRPEHIAQLVVHQQVCFPTLDPDAWMTAEHFAAQIAVFPAGQHVALDGARVVGQSSTLRVSTARAFAPHRFVEIIGKGFFSTHEPDGEWLYGADMSVLPDYRGRKISRMLYDARKQLVQQLGLRGMVAGGQLPGYHHVQQQFSVEEYITQVQRGDRFDPTLTPQIRSGFTARGVIRDYVDDAEHGSAAALIVWDNPASSRQA